jgi:hypothetical protein
VLIIFISIFIPLALVDSCWCFYTADTNGWEIASMASVSTRMSRAATMSQQCPPGKPCHVFATLPEDTDTAVFINVQAHVDVTSITFKYDTEAYYLSHNKNLAQTGQPVAYVFDQLEKLGARTQHSVLLTSLTPNTRYVFEVTYGGEVQYTGIYKTLPSATDPITIKTVLGGDQGSNKTATEMTASLFGVTPDVIIVGGDIAYDNAIPACYYSWDLWFNQFDSLNKQLGYHVPLILGIGNHDVGYRAFTGNQPDPKNLPFFFQFFPQHYAKAGPAVPPMSERKSYYHHIIGKSIYFSLDSNYVVDYKGPQLDWIKTICNAHPTYAKFAYYHVPTYTTCFDELDNDEEKRDYAKEHWAPVFEQYHFRGIFENHVHMLKKTFPLTNGVHDPTNGVTYYGDGNWGVVKDNCTAANDGNSTGILSIADNQNHVWVIKTNLINYDIYPIGTNGTQIYPNTVGTI